MSQMVERTGLFTSTQLYEPSHAEVLPPAPMLTEFAPILVDDGPVVGYGNAVLKDHLTLERRMVALEDITEKVTAYCKMLSTELPRKLKSKISKQTNEIIQEKVLQQQEEMLHRISVLEQRFDGFVEKFNRLLSRMSKSRSSSPEHSSMPPSDTAFSHTATIFETPTAKRASTSHGQPRIEVTPSMARTRRDLASANTAHIRQGAQKEMSSAEIHELQSLGNDVNDIEAFTSTIDVDKEATNITQKGRVSSISSATSVSMPPAGPAGKRPGSAIHNYRPSMQSSVGINNYGSGSGIGNTTEIHSSGSSVAAPTNSYRSRVNSSMASMTNPEQSLLMHIGNQALIDKPSSTRSFPTVEAARTFEVIPGMSDDESSSSAFTMPSASQVDDIFAGIGSSLRSTYIRDNSPILAGKGTRSSTRSWLTSTSPTGTRAPSTDGSHLGKGKSASRQSELTLGRILK